MSDDKIGIEQLVCEIIEFVDIETDPAPDGLGRKSHVGELVSEELEDGTIGRVFIQFYVQYTMPLVPSDKAMGYTRDDVIEQAGVVMADVEEQTDPPRYRGEVLEQQVFIDQFLTTDAAKNRVDRLFETLEDKARLSDDWIAHINSLYNDRIPGKRWITNDKRIN